jgi:hypothetical protein
MPARDPASGLPLKGPEGGVDMTYSFPHAQYDDVPRRWTRVNEPPPPIARVARNRGLTPLQTYLRLLEEDRIDLNTEVDQFGLRP